jgi:hypothetical protein
MTDLTTRNILLYVGSMLIGAVAAALAALLVQLSGADPVNWRPVLAAGLGPVVTGLLATRLTRVGSEPIAAQVDNLKSVGVPRRDMIVVTRDDAVATAAEALTPTQVQQVADELERRMRDAPAEET